MYTSIYQNVIFIEGEHPKANKLRDIAVELRFRYGAQMKNLNDVKEEMARKVREARGNCIVNFTYGQKSRLFANDGVTFWGKGICAELPYDVYRQLYSQCTEQY
jgi:hypothetical protein